MNEWMKEWMDGWMNEWIIWFCYKRQWFNYTLTEKLKYWDS